MAAALSARPAGARRDDAGRRRRRVRRGDRMMTVEFFRDVVLKDLATTTRDFVNEKIKEAVAPLERRIAELEAKPHVKFCGVYDEARTYAVGDAVVRQAACGSRRSTRTTRRRATRRPAGCSR